MPHSETGALRAANAGSAKKVRKLLATIEEFPQNLGALVANPFAFSVLLIARSGIARYGSIDPETSLTY